ncbi:MAG: DUF3568 family protein [Candidatus Omnitrophica bacterium]|nr:DUF3568 family protein [Candidatus Omnitrophota bacterium]
MKKAAFLFVLVATVVNLTGCWFIVGGAAGAAGAYVMGKDYMVGNTDRPYESLWNAAMTVARIRGKIQQEDIAGGYIEVAVDSTLVKINLTRVSQATTKVKVAARKHHMPNLTLAQEIFIKIMEEAK